MLSDEDIAKLNNYLNILSLSTLLYRFANPPPVFAEVEEAYKDVLFNYILNNYSRNDSKPT